MTKTMQLLATVHRNFATAKSESMEWMSCDCHDWYQVRTITADGKLGKWVRVYK